MCEMRSEKWDVSCELGVRSEESAGEHGVLPGDG